MMMIPPSHVQLSQNPLTTFHGSALEAGCGGGSVLYLAESDNFKIQMDLGRGTNNYAELMKAKFLIQFIVEKHCRDLQLLGNSKVVCHWINKTQNYTTFSPR